MFTKSIQPMSTPTDANRHRILNTRRIKLCVVGLMGWSCLMLSGQARADTLLYSENFDDGVADGFTATTGGTSPSGSFVVDNGTYNNVLTSSNGSSLASSAVTLSNYSVGQDFRISTDFTLNSFTGDGPTTGTNAINLGLGFLGSSSNFDAGSRYRVVYTVDSSGPPGTGFLTLLKNTTTLATSATGVAPVNASAYTLTVSGTFANNTLQLTGGLSNVNGGSTTVSFTDTSILTGLGQNFGFRDGVNRVTGATTVPALDVSYDNFSVTQVTPVPEPTTLAMFAMGGLSLVGRLRRRRTNPLSK